MFTNLTDPNLGIVRTIQLSIAPVFLLSAIGIYLSLFSSRLARIVDRTRMLTALGDLPASDPRRLERERLEGRKRLIRRAITLFTYAAVLIAAIVALLFLSAYFELPIDDVIAWLFISSMTCIIVGFLNYLAEVHSSLNWVEHSAPPV